MKKNISLFIIGLSFSIPSLAGYNTGKISGFIPYQNGTKSVLIFNLENNVSGGCNMTGRFVLDGDDPKFKGSQATVIAAYFNATPVTVLYRDTCLTWGNSADVEAICVGVTPC